jgi:hypothetical protein
VSTTCVPSKAPRLRARSTAGRRKAASGSGSAVSCSAANMTATQGANSSAATVRISTGMAGDATAYRVSRESLYQLHGASTSLSQLLDGLGRHPAPG